MTRQDMPMLIVYEGDMEGQRWVIDKDKMIIDPDIGTVREQGVTT